jgi:hypothetical protein
MCNGAAAVFLEPQASRAPSPDQHWERWGRPEAAVPVALVMLAVGALMLKGRGDPGNPRAECNREKAPTVVACGLGSGLFSGFFGITGGFLVVPGLIASTGMPLLFAVGTSLVAVTAFGLTTAANYAISGLVDWPLAVVRRHCRKSCRDASRSPAGKGNRKAGDHIRNGGLYRRRLHDGRSAGAVMAGWGDDGGNPLAD